MKKKIIYTLIICSLSLISISACSTPSPEPVPPTPSDLKEWTVLSYICGSDLEIQNGVYTDMFKNIADKVTPNKNVNYIVQTGGTTKWLNDLKDIGMDLNVEKSQRFIYSEKGKYTKVYENVPQNMAKAKTLSDFIKWGVENYPAKHYEIVLNDHGGGGYFGMLYDTQFSPESDKGCRNIMTFDILESALKTAGCHFDIFNYACCDNACLEGIQAISDYADYMLGFEDSSTTKGDSTVERLTYLNENYTKTPLEITKAFGKIIGEKEQKSGIKTLTVSSAIDLSKADELTLAFNNYFRALGNKLDDVKAQSAFTKSHFFAEKMTTERLVDLYSLVDIYKNNGYLTEEANEIEKIINEMVITLITGTSHTKSHGINFTYNTHYTTSELDHLVRGEMHNYDYIAYLDAITSYWEAPPFIYEKVEPFIDGDSDVYNIKFISNFDNFIKDGTASFEVKSGKDSISYVSSVLYWQKSEGSLVSLGEYVDVDYDPNTGKGSLCYNKEWAYFVAKEDKTITQKVPLTLVPTKRYVDSTLYCIPIIYNAVGMLFFESDIITTFENTSLDYEIYGIRPYTSVNEKMPDGDFVPWETEVKKSSILYSLYEGVDTSYHRTRINASDRGLRKQIALTEGETIDISNEKLDAGIYYFRIICKDAFGRDVYDDQITKFEIK